MRGRPDGQHVGTSRTEVRQASETITAVGAGAAANSPVLIALNERLEKSLAPRIEQMQQALAPVREAMTTIANAVSLANSLRDGGVGRVRGARDLREVTDFRAGGPHGLAAGEWTDDTSMALALADASRRSAGT